MATPRNYYEELGVKRDATADEIRKAYRKLARTWHPDVNKSPDAEKRFAAISEAYEVLGDPDKRKTYDQFGRAGVAGGVDFTDPGFGAGAWRGPRARGAGPDVGSIFEEMFGGRSPFDDFETRGPVPRKGPDVSHRITVSFLTAALGGEERLRLSIDGRERSVDVKIPPCIEPGARLRVKGGGRPGLEGGASGDLILTVEVGRHPCFRRDGRDILIDVPISIAEAGLGTTVRVPLLKGSVQLKVPAGASSGQKLRLRGRGATDAKGRTGDFFAVVQIVGPAGLSERGRRLLRELAEELPDPRESEPWSEAESRRVG